MLAGDPHLELLVTEANLRDTVEVQRHGPRCTVHFKSWSGDLFWCVRPHGHGYLHQTAPCPGGDEWTWSDEAAAGNLTNLDAENLAAEHTNRRALGAPAALHGPNADTPVPRLVQGLVRSFVQREAASAVRGFLDNVRRQIETA